MQPCVLLQERVGNLTTDVTVISGLANHGHGAECDHAIVVHIPHLCTLRYQHNVAEVAAGIAYTTSRADGRTIDDAFVQACVDGVADARLAAASGMKLALVDTAAW